MFIDNNYVLDVLKTLLYLNTLTDSEEFAAKVLAAIKPPNSVKPTIETTPDGFVVRIGDMFIGMYEYCRTYFVQFRFDHAHYQGQISQALQPNARNAYYEILDRLTAPQVK